MAKARTAPDAILAITNLSPNTLSYITDDPDSPDANWLVASGNNVATDVRVSFPTPSGTLSSVANTQEFRALVRQFNEAQSGTPTARVELWESGTLVRAGTDTSVPVGGLVLSFTWSASEIISAANVECKVVGTQTGGSPSARNTVDVGAIEWNVGDTSTGISTIKPTGGDYTTLTAWESDKQGVLGWVEQADCYVFSGGLDDKLSINGSTPSASGYMLVSSPASERHAGLWNSSKFYIAPTSDGVCIELGDDYAESEYLQIQPNGASSNSFGAAGVFSTDTHTSLHNCIIDGHGSSNCSGIGSTIAKVYRNIVYDCQNATYGGIQAHTDGLYSPVTYQNTVYNCSIGITGLGTASIVKGNAVFGNTTNFTGTFDTTNSGYNATDSASAPGSNNQLSKTTANQFVNLSAGSEDLHLKAGADCIDTGTNLGSPYDIDIDGESVTGTWDIGADEKIAGGPTFTQDVIGNMPSAAGNLAIQVNFSSSVTGNMPAASGTLLKGVSTSVSGSMPANSGALIKQTNLSPAGTMPASAGILTSSLVFTQSNTGAMPASAGNLAKQTNKALSGTLPASSGTLTKLIGKLLDGSMPASSGSLERLTSKMLAGNMPPSSGTVDASLTFLQSVAGIMGALSGGVTKQIQLPLSGNMPASSGVITKLIGKGLDGVFGVPAGTVTKQISLSPLGNMPPASGSLAAGFIAQQAISGIMGAITGIVNTVFSPSGGGGINPEVFRCYTQVVKKVYDRVAGRKWRDLNE